MRENEDWITVTEAAEISGYHPEHIRRVIREGKIDARKFSIVWQISKSSLLDYISDQKKDAEKT